MATWRLQKWVRHTNFFIQNTQMQQVMSFNRLDIFSTKGLEAEAESLVEANTAEWLKAILFKEVKRQFFAIDRWVPKGNNCSLFNLESNNKSLQRASVKDTRRSRSASIDAAKCQMQVRARIRNTGHRSFVYSDIWQIKKKKK